MHSTNNKSWDYWHSSFHDPLVKRNHSLAHVMCALYYVLLLVLPLLSHCLYQSPQRYYKSVPCRHIQSMFSDAAVFNSLDMRPSPLLVCCGDRLRRFLMPHVYLVQPRQALSVKTLSDMLGQSVISCPDPDTIFSLPEECSEGGFRSHV